jgi:hypothetical protein
VTLFVPMPTPRTPAISRNPPSAYHLHYHLHYYPAYHSWANTDAKYTATMSGLENALFNLKVC